MRKRKWWIIALSIAFLAACVAVGRWSEQVPYRFLERRPRIFAEIDSSGTYSEYYAFSETASRVDELISKEVAPDTPGRDWVFGFGRGYGPVSMRRYPFEIMATGALTLMKIPTVPMGTRAIVTVSRTASPLDRLKAWLYSLRFDGPPM